jgi:tetratricopeptide (TPR) repeat protein
VNPLAQRALENGDWDAALDALERGVMRAPNPVERAKLGLELAGVWALYGKDGVEGLSAALQDAALTRPAVREGALFKALRASSIAFALEADLSRGLSGREDLRFGRGVELALEAVGQGGDEAHPEIHFHAGAALVSLGEPARALEVLDAISLDALPTHLRWRWHSWRGGALEDLSRWREAALAYRAGANATRGVDRAALLQDEAAMLLELEEPHAALETLALAQRELGGFENPLDAASRLHLEARAHLQLNNPSLARERAEAAANLELTAGEPSFGVALVLGQTLAALEDWRGAIAAFSSAAEIGSPLDRGFALHEMGLAQMDAGLPEESRATLQSVLEISEYPHRGEVLSDLAELEYRLGNFDAAQAHAGRALEAGATVPASLMLANVAYEYYRLDEALEHYNRALEHAAEGGRDWVLAHQMTADTLVQLGWRDPERILYHASTARPHLEPSDEWAVTLDGYIERAKGMLLGSGSRTLN